MLICKSCGTAYPKEEPNFCGECGEKLNEFCPNCCIIGGHFACGLDECPAFFYELVGKLREKAEKEFKEKPNRPFF